jgi:hypothetical protein
MQVSSHLHTSAVLHPGKEPLVPIRLDSGLRQIRGPTLRREEPMHIANEFHTKHFVGVVWLPVVSSKWENKFASSITNLYQHKTKFMSSDVLEMRVYSSVEYTPPLSYNPLSTEVHQNNI